MNSNKTKIVATMGPATASLEVLRDMILAGVNICRLNFSHGDYEAVKKTIANIRAINQELGYNVGMLADLQGPKLRIGVMKEKGAELIAGKQIRITTHECEGTARQCR